MRMFTNLFNKQFTKVNYQLFNKKQDIIKYFNFRLFPDKKPKKFSEVPYKEQYENRDF
jgi:hypothetical protein